MHDLRQTLASGYDCYLYGAKNLGSKTRREVFCPARVIANDTYSRRDYRLKSYSDGFGTETVLSIGQLQSFAYKLSIIIH